MESTVSMSVNNDAVSQVLGKERPGKIRGMGRGITATKITFMQARDSHVLKFEAKQAELQDVVRGLQDVVRELTASKCNQVIGVLNSEANDLTKGTRCQILDWCEMDDVVIGEREFCLAEPTYKIGRILLGNRNRRRKILIYDWPKEDELTEGLLESTDPKKLVNNIPLGPNTAIVKVDKVLKEHVYLWRPNEEKLKIGDAIRENITWPIHNILKVNVLPNRGELISKSRSPATASNSSNTNKNDKKKCILLDCKGSGEKVTEGRVFSTNSEDVVHFVLLGPNASKIWVDLPVLEDASLWRTNTELQIMVDAQGSVIAWPNDKLLYI